MNIETIRAIFNTLVEAYQHDAPCLNEAKAKQDAFIKDLRDRLEQEFKNARLD